VTRAVCQLFRPSTKLIAPRAHSVSGTVASGLYHREQPVSGSRASIGIDGDILNKSTRKRLFYASDAFEAFLIEVCRDDGRCMKVISIGLSPRDGQGWLAPLAMPNH